MTNQEKTQLELQIEKLRILQSSLMVLQLKVKDFHWHCAGNHFFELHKQTDKLSEALIELIDLVAEKIVMRDQRAIGSFQEALKLSTIRENEHQNQNDQWFGMEIIKKTLTLDLETIIQLTDEVPSTALVQPILDEIYLVIDKFKWQFSKL